MQQNNEPLCQLLYVHISRETKGLAVSRMTSYTLDFDPTLERMADGADSTSESY